MFSMALVLRFFCGTFILRMEIKLQLRFVFRHCEVFFITSQLCYLFVTVVTFFMTLELHYILVRSNYVLKNITITFLFVRHCDAFLLRRN